MLNCVEPVGTEADVRDSDRRYTGSKRYCGRHHIALHPSTVRICVVSQRVTGILMVVRVLAKRRQYGRFGHVPEGEAEPGSQLLLRARDAKHQ